MYNKIILFIGGALFVSLIMTSCSFKTKKQIEELRNSNIELSLDSLTKVKPFRGFDNEMGNSEHLKLVVFLDSANCTSCNLMHINNWNSIIYKANQITAVDFIFIMETTSENKEEIISLYHNSLFHYNIYLDLNHITKQKNSFLDNPLFHCLLVDKNDKIIFVGNPLNSEKVQESFLQGILYYTKMYSK